MTSLNVAHGHVFPTFYPQCTKRQRANSSWFRAFGRDILQETAYLTGRRLPPQTASRLDTFDA